ncbi:MAG: DNA internalization-related competence protein ComEC/Rec2 [Burkholderiaceae bacterium]|nr:DNA internalization-related competence protein ComEC/Rec2 [Burkholderiaceae bacterium]
MGRLIALSIVAASVFIQTLAHLPQWFDLLGLFVIVCLAWIFFYCCSWLSVVQNKPLVNQSIRYFKRVILLILVFTLSLAWSTWRAQIRMADRLSSEHENVVSRIQFEITGMVQDQGDSLRFEVQVLPIQASGERPQGIPRHIQVVWRKADAEKTPHGIRPGQTWRAALIFRQPRGTLNPHSFDYEAHLFSRNIRAIGRVRGKPVLMSEAPFSSMQVMVSGARQYLRQSMREHVGDMTFGAVLIALAIGDQDSVKAEHWEIFNKTGITHLVSISGSHVTMLAAFGGLSMLWLWKRLRWRRQAAAEWIPAKVVAGIAALCIAWLYCLLAGWGVPARRTFFMLFVSGLVMLSRLPISASSVLCLAAAIVTLIDPWSPVATGFWLSFGAVAVLFYVGSQMQVVRNDAMTFSHRGWNILKASARLQWIITLAMLPALAYLFQQVSLTSPFANAIAIPVITFVVTPLALLMALVALIPGLDAVSAWIAWFAHLALDWTMVPVTWLAFVPSASLTVAAMPIWCLLLSLVGIVWALQPPGVPVRWVGWTMLLPALTWQPQALSVGAWQLTALDVGQGGAIIVRTKRHTLLFDAGPRLGISDAGQRVIAPVLRALGVRHIDTLVISHPDIDHAGGLPGLLREMPVSAAYTSFDLNQFLKHTQHVLKLASPIVRPNKRFDCEAGLSWSWDNVRFTFLHPIVTNMLVEGLIQKKHSKNKIKSNARSCVLYIQGTHHSALLPGDIGIKEEHELLDRHVFHNAGAPIRADVVLVAHHGSTSSSSERFISQLGTLHAIAQVGYLNRFSHPAPEVEQRWKSTLAAFWRTDRDGAVTAESSESGMQVFSQAHQRQRYWHQRN